MKQLIEKQDWSHLTADQKKQLSQVVLTHNKLFMLDQRDLGTIWGESAHISVANNNPCRSPSYRYPEYAKDAITKMLIDMEERGIIEPSSSAWLSPIVLVNKPDGTKRMCLDFRRMNLSDDVYPLPQLEDLVGSAAGHQIYVTLDLKDAYFQIPLDENSRDLTTFSDRESLYRFRLSCAPAIFSRKMAELLTSLLREGWGKNYLDDVII